MNEEKLTELLTHMKRYGTINNEDIPKLVALVEDLQASEKLAWLQFNLAWKRIQEEL
jgi:hypothetical protein